MESRAFFRLPVIGLLTLVYFIAGKFGLMLASLHASASPVWPPAGIALAALLLLGYRAWPAIFVGAFLVNVSAAGNVVTSLAVASGNTLEAVCGAWLVNRFAGGITVFDRPQGVFKFALAAVLSTIISPAFGVTSLALAGFADWTNYGAIWLTWWLGDTTGDLLIAPLIILWSIGPRQRWNRREAIEVGILLLLLFVLSEAVFGGWLTISARNYPIPFIAGPIVIWTAFRFTQRETATGIFILSAVAIWGTLHGFGPFAGETENQSLLALQSWTALLTITALALSAGMAERRRAEDALRESEARINLAANAANLGLWLWNIPGDELWVTEEWRKMFGLADSKPVTFDRLLDIVHPGDRGRMKKIVRHMFERGGEYENEYRITRPDGSIRWIAGHGSVELDERGKVAFARGVSRDITKRKTAEEELRESEVRFRTVADAAPVLIWMSGPDKLCTFFNKPWLDFTGRSPEQEMGNGWSECVHPDDLQKCLKVYTEAFDARKPFVMQYRLRRHDGEYRWVSDQGVARHDTQGNFTGYIGSCVDVTELINKEQALHESDEKFRLAVEAAPSGIVLVDREGRIVLVNNHIEELFGYRREELVGKLVDVLVPDRFVSQHPEHRRKFLAAPAARMMGAGRELFARRKDGTEFPVEIGLNPIETADGTLVLAAVADITARKQAELQALRHREELGHLSRVAAMGQLAASIAHELNQPLSGITSNASAGQRFIDRGNVDLRELRDLLGDIVADGQRAGDVIRGLQSMVKKEVRARQRVNLNDLVTNVVRMVNPNAMLLSCQLETSLEPNLPEIEADPVQLQQVLLNLIVNAFDAMTDTPMNHRKVVIVTERNGDGAICASVRDYGSGIPEEVGERVFEQFFTTKARGLGMGLSIVRSIVKSHGGTIAAENAEGGGARFHFTLPANAVTSAI